MRVSLIKLRILLLSNSFYFFLCFLTCIYVCIHIFCLQKETQIDPKTTQLSGTIQSISYKEDQVKLKIKVKKEYVIGYIKKELFHYELHDCIQATGTLEIPSNNTMKNLFNYKKYSYYNNTFYTMEIKNLKLISKNQNPFYKIKAWLIQKMETYKSRAYLKLFLLGTTDELDKDVYKSFQENGISHLFSVSGMHVSLLAGVLLFFLKKLKVKEDKRYIVVFFFLLFYLFLTNYLAPILRSVVFFIFVCINKRYDFHIKAIHLLLMTLCVCLLIDPYYLFNIGFLFSFVITFYLMFFSKQLNTKSKLKNLLLVSFVSFFAGLPISLYNFFSINVLSILYNLFFVPFVSILVFPFSLLTFVFPFLDSILFALTKLLEAISLFVDQIDLLKLSFSKPSLWIVLFYYACISFSLYKFFLKDRKYLYLFLLVLTFHYYDTFFFKNKYMVLLDVGQGDSILLHAHTENILVDTGGKITTNKDSYLANNLISYFKSLGIKHLDYLILTHGDYDHMGEAMNLVNRFPVHNVLFNNNAYNKNEQQLIEVLKKKKISYAKFKEGSQLSLKEMQIYSINKAFSDENESSLVLYVKIGSYTLLLTGDASITSEDYFVNNYQLYPDILKLGHHGARTSTSTFLLDSTKPRLALISCGLDNKYKHPHKEVLDRLKQYQIPYLSTSEVGSIKINFTQGGTIETSPA